jgi:cell division protease FtsH
MYKKNTYHRPFIFILLVCMLGAPVPVKALIIVDEFANLNDKVASGLLDLFNIKPKKTNPNPSYVVETAKKVDTTKTTETKTIPETKTTFDDVVGLENIITEVKEVVEFLKNPDKFKSVGARVPRGILLEGPPGTGKTLIARAIAHEAGCNFLYEPGSSFVEMYVGVGSQRVRDLFNRARKNKPTIIFIDEFDAIGAVARGVGANEEYRQTMNELLCQLDGFQSDDSIIVIAATNYAKALDPALTRAGRFDRILKISLPNLKSRKQILTHYKNKLPSAQVTDQCIDETALKTNGMNGADLRNLVNEAALAAVREGQATVIDKHFVAGMEKVLGQRRP